MCQYQIVLHEIRFKHHTQNYFLFDPWLYLILSSSFLTLTQGHKASPLSPLHYQQQSNGSILPSKPLKTQNHCRDMPNKKKTHHKANVSALREAQLTLLIRKKPLWWDVTHLQHPQFVNGKVLQSMPRHIKCCIATTIGSVCVMSPTSTVPCVMAGWHVPCSASSLHEKKLWFHQLAGAPEKPCLPFSNDRSCCNLQNLWCTY